MKTTRRDFIKISSLGAGGLTLAPNLKWLSEKEYPTDDTELKRTPMVCEICFWKCAGWVYTDKDKKIRKLIGNKEDQHSNGRLCPRGTGGLGMYYDNDRLKWPLLRVEEDGKQVFKKVSWDEALDFIAKKLKGVKEKYGAESLGLFAHGTVAEHLIHFTKAFGSKNIGEPAYAQCMGPRMSAFKLTYGTTLRSPEPLDIRNAKCMVLIGSHYGENMHNGFVQEMSEMIDNGASIITVDPRFSTAASKSKYWLAIKPSTDIALLLAWMNILINENLYDKKFIEQNTYGFDQLKAHVQPYTPEWAASITTLDPDLIRKSAYEMAKAAPASIVNPGRHATWYGDDTQRERAIAILNALLGNWAKKGGIYQPEKLHVPEFPQEEYPKPKWAWRDAINGRFPFANTGVTNALIDISHPDNKSDKKIKAWIIIATNLTVSVPNKKRTLEAIDNQDLVVAIDTMPSEITGYADIVLPEATYLERWDSLRISQHRKPAVALRMPAVKAKWDLKPSWWMTRELGLRLGLEGFYKWKTYDEVLEWQLKHIGTSLEEMKKIGVKTFEREYDDIYVDGPMDFNTNTGKIELYSTDLADMNFDPLPKYIAHTEPDPGFYRMIYGRVPMHTFGRTQNNPFLYELRKEGFIWVNPIVADEWGLTNGQKVWLKNQDGVVSTDSSVVRVTERIRFDSVYVPHGFGQGGNEMTKKLSRAHGNGIADSEMITNITIDEIMGGTGMRGNFVTFITEDPRKEIES